MAEAAKECAANCSHDNSLSPSLRGSMKAIVDMRSGEVAVAGIVQNGRWTSSSPERSIAMFAREEGSAREAQFLVVSAECV